MAEIAVCLRPLKDNRLARDQVIEVRAALGTSVANRLIESLPRPESHGAHRVAGWRGRLLPDRRVVDRDHRRPAHAASIAFRIPAPETPDQRQSEEGTSGVHGDENRPSVQTGTALR